jgi:hypothetical protein
VIGLAASSQAAVIFYDNFDGLAGTNLNGTIPDITTDGAAWQAGTWVKANGSYGGGATGQTFTAALPFTPTIGAAYELSAMVNNSGTDWLGIAFLNTAPTVGNRLLDNSPYLWEFVRGRLGSGKDQSLIGPGNQNGLGNASTFNAAKMKVRLEMINSTQWVVKWFFNDSLQFQRTVNADACGITINYVAFGSNGMFSACTGTISSFKFEEIPQALKPNPANNSMIYSTDVSLQWQPGIYAAKHDVYLDTDFTDVNDATEGSHPGVTYYSYRQDANSYSATGLTPGATYYWRIDEVRADGTTIDRGEVWSFKVQGFTAYNSSPPEGAKYMATDVNLVWSPGKKAKKHDVYLGTDLSKVTDANRANHTGVQYYNEDQDPNTYNPPTNLTLGTTYYWRIDEVNSPNIWKGDVWSFETMPSIPDTGDPDLMGWWKFDEDWGTKALDWSGHGYHGTLVNGPQWASGLLNGALQFDGLNDYVSLPIGSVINSLSSATFITWVNWARIGANTQRIFDIGTGTAAYMFLIPGNGGGGGSMQFNITTAGGTVTLTASSLAAGWHHVVVVTNGVSKTIQLYVDGAIVASGSTTVLPSDLGNTTNNWLGRSQAGDYTWFTGLLDDFRIYKRAFTQDDIGKLLSPLESWAPNPANGATGIEATLTLAWKPGKQVAKHNVYFGDNFDDVNDANSSGTPGPTEIYRARQDANDYPIPEALRWGQTYYWRVDEVNDYDPNIWRGAIWSFTVRNYIVVDNFEDYNNTSNKIQNTWIKGGGGTAGYPDPNYAERSIIHGGLQSMPFDYNNTKTPYYSDANCTFDSPQNWAASGSNVLKILSLWFRGYPERIGSFSYTGTANPYAATMYACGADIGNVADLRRPSRFHDECHFGYKEATAATTTTLPGTSTNFTGVKIIAKVDSIGNPGDTVGKAGVMIRDSLDANSVNGFMCVRRTGANTYGVAFQYRNPLGSTASTAKGGSTATDVNDSGITLPCWVALTLQSASGSRNVRAFYSKNSTNGTDGTWYQLGTVQQFPSGTMTLPRTPGVYIGLAATPQSNTVTRIAKFSSVSITAGTGLVNWKSRDIGIKSNVAMPTPLYVTLRDSNSNTATVTYSYPYIVLQNTWQQWEIPLSDFAGVDLRNITKITIGTGNGSSSSGAGTLYFDDIGLYIPRCVANAVAPDFTGSGCLVDNQDLRILTDNWLITDYQVTPATSWDPNNDANLVARYRFEGNYQDSKGTNHGDPCNTSVTTVNDAIRGGQVASFDGVNSYIALKQMDGNDFTLSAWIKTSAPGARAGTRAYQGSGLIWSDVSGDSGDFILAVLGTKLAAATGPGTQDITSIGDVVTGQWVHVAMVRTRSLGKVELYINGMLDRTSLSGGTGSLTANPRILIGANTIDGYYYKGLVDDVWIYSRALTAAEVARLAGKTTAYNVPVSALVTNPAVNLYNDGRIDIRDYAILASKWLEVLQWAP